MVHSLYVSSLPSNVGGEEDEEAVLYSRRRY